MHGVSTRKVDDLVKALSVEGISKSEVSRVCGELDTMFDGRVISQATVVAFGVTSDAERQVLGVDVGPSEDKPIWTAFLRSLAKRGLKRVRLVISGAHVGLIHAISTVLSGTMRSIRSRGHVGKGEHEPLACPAPQRLTA